MSHFTVAVRLTAPRLARHAAKLGQGVYDERVVASALKEILAPYNENVEEGDEFAQFKDVTDESLKEYDTESDGKGVPHKTKYSTFEAFMKDWHGYKKPNAAGRWGYWRNPNKKWDWYSIGGRWRGFFPVKPDAQKFIGEAGAGRNAPREGGSDVIRRHELDFDGIAVKAEEAFAKFKGEYRAYLNGRKFDVFDGPREDLLEMGIVRVEKDPEAPLQEGEQVVGGFWGDEHKHIKGTDREKWRDISKVLTDEQLERYRAVFNPISTYAALDDDGWHAPGEMGWFGVSHAEPNDYLAFKDMFNEKFIKGLGDEDLLVLVDCHI